MAAVGGLLQSSVFAISPHPVFADIVLAQDLAGLMHFADLDPSNRDLHALELVPMQIKNFRLFVPERRDIEWIARTLDRKCQRFGTRLTLDSERQLVVAGPRAGS
jgi:hypothetical protein